MKKIIKVRPTERGVNEILDLQEELGLEELETREARKKLYSKEFEVLYG